jgi:hypothetical protein
MSKSILNLASYGVPIQNLGDLLRSSGVIPLDINLLRIHDTYKWELVNGQLLLALMD